MLGRNDPFIALQIPCDLIRAATYVKDPKATFQRNLSVKQMHDLTAVTFFPPLNHEHLASFQYLCYSTCRNKEGYTRAMRILRWLAVDLSILGVVLANLIEIVLATFHHCSTRSADIGANSLWLL